MAAQTVSFGIFRFCTLQQLDAIRLQFASDAGDAMQTLASASVNGQSFSYNGVAYEREEFGDKLAAAYNDLGEFRYGTPSSNRSAADFRSAGVGSLYRNC